MPWNVIFNDMEFFKRNADKDLFLAAITVIPACSLWIMSESLAQALVLGGGIFLAAEYGVPAWRRGQLQPAVRFIAAALKAAFQFARDALRPRSAEVRI